MAVNAKNVILPNDIEAAMENTATTSSRRDKKN